MTEKILHVYKTYYPDPPGGLQEAIRQIASSTKEHGITSYIYTLSPNPLPSSIQSAEATIYRGKSWIAPASCDIGDFRAFKLFSELTKKMDLIHYHFPWPFADLMHLVVQPSIPAIMTYHSDIVRQKLLGFAYSPLRQRMLSSMKAIVATSPPYTRSSSILSDERIANLVRVIPLAIEESTYPIEGDHSIFEKLGLNPKEPFFLFIGVLRYYKGLHYLIEAAASLSTKIIIAGSGPELENLKTLSIQKSARNIIFAGRVTDTEKIALLQQCRAFVLPSHLRSEAYGMVLVEASMFGKAMITCEIGTGTSFVNLHEKTGIVIPPENTQALKNALFKLATNKDLATLYGCAARLRYEEFFSGQALGNAYAKLYREVIEN